ncbi:NUDIX domain-containing protein [Candidatus Pacearchaeota archaeon]|nr:NUDIX domain-containing protein [Candidatus Pacearchaeota archaeon]
MEQGTKAPFHVVLLAVIFDPAKRKILIAKRGHEDEDIQNLVWQFPEARLRHGDNIDEILKVKVKEKTGLNIENLGAIFSKVYPEKKDLLGIYYLCEATSGKIKAANDFVELEWISPKEVEKYFTTSFHPKLKEYLNGLVNGQ